MPETGQRASASGYEAEWAYGNEEAFFLFEILIEGMKRIEKLL